MSFYTTHGVVVFDGTLCPPTHPPLHCNNLEQRLLYCCFHTNPPVDLMLHFTSILPAHEQQPKIGLLELLHFGQQLPPSPEGAIRHGLRLGDTHSHPGRFTLECKLPQCMLKVTA